jgi:hypothetical protein
MTYTANKYSAVVVTSELFVIAYFIIGFSEINLCEIHAHVKNVTTMRSDATECCENVLSAEEKER